MLGPQIGPVCLGNVKLVVLPYFDKALDREGVKDKEQLYPSHPDKVTTPHRA